MIIGNDIIDLLIDRSDDQRFAQRTLSADELASIGGRTDGLPVVCFFGVKEAFYKSIRQIDSDYPLKPRSINVDFSTCAITSEGHQGRFKYHRNQEFFYSWTLPEPGTHVINVVATLPINISDDPDSESKGVRELARTVLNGIYGLPAEEFNFVKGPGGEPVAMHEEDILTCSMSFTHHGRYCAVALSAEGHLKAARVRRLKEQLQGKSVYVDIQNIELSS